MKRTEHNNKLCPIAQSLGLIGDSWSLLILRNCFMGTRRFEVFQSELGLTRHILTSRLKKLVEEQVLQKKSINPQKTRFEYRLTEKGKALAPVFLALSTWANEWLVKEGKQAMYYHHLTCDQATRPTMHCDCCGEPLKSDVVEVKLTSYSKEKVRDLSSEEQIKAFGFAPRVDK